MRMMKMMISRRKKIRWRSNLADTDDYLDGLIPSNPGKLHSLEFVGLLRKIPTFDWILPCSVSRITLANIFRLSTKVFL